MVKWARATAAISVIGHQTTFPDYLFKNRHHMNSNDMSIEDLIPHRGRMKLIDEIIEMDENRAVTRSVVKETWPFFDGESVNPIVLIELVAQTAGISNACERINGHGIDSEKKGWLVGIKLSRFSIGAIALNTRIITTILNVYKYDGFREIQGKNQIEHKIIGEVTLQVYQPDLNEK